MEDSNSPVYHFTYTNILTTALVYLTVSIAYSFWRAPRYPTNLPWVGHGKGWWASLSNTFGAFTNSKRWLDEGYNKYSKNGQSFVLPSTIGSAAEVVIPRSQMQWMIDQPDDVLSTSAAHYDLLRGDYNFVDRIMLKDPYHEHIVHKNLARNLNALIPDLQDEVNRVADEFFGSREDEWRSVNVLDTFMKLVPKITNRMVVGAPLCRNQVYLDNMEGFTNDVIRGLLLYSLVPEFLHPIVGRIAGLSSKYHYWRTCRHSSTLR